MEKMSSAVAAVGWSGGLERLPKALLALTQRRHLQRKGRLSERHLERRKSAPASLHPRLKEQLSRPTEEEEEDVKPAAEVPSTAESPKLRPSQLNLKEKRLRRRTLATIGTDKRERVLLGKSIHSSPSPLVPAYNEPADFSFPLLGRSLTPSPLNFPNRCFSVHLCSRTVSQRV